MSDDDRYDDEDVHVASDTRDEDDAYGTAEPYDQPEASEDATEGWWGDGVIGLVFIAGVILLLFPEPATSTIGLGLIVLALGAWLIEAFT